LLYQYAVAAHHHAHSHIQQAFVPRDIDCNRDDVEPLVQYASTPSPFQPDPLAAQKSLGLLTLALDFLRVGLQLALSPRERVAYVTEYATVGIKVLQAGSIDDKRIAADVDAAISSLPRLDAPLKWLQVKLAFMQVRRARSRLTQGRHRAATRLARQFIQSSDSPVRLYILLLEYASPTEALCILQELEARKLETLAPYLALIRTRLLFVQRRWDDVPTALDQLAASIGWHEDSLTAATTDTYMHYLMLRCLWEGRIGNDVRVRSLLRQMYTTMDEAADTSAFEAGRASGGVVKLDMGEQLLLQSTPPNILMLSTYLVSLTCRRDYIGTAGKCPSLRYAGAMREFAAVGRKDDMWDLGCRLWGMRR
jgi:hypothetical protein